MPLKATAPPGAHTAPGRLMVRATKRILIPGGAPPPFPVGFAVGGGRFDSQNRRFPARPAPGDKDKFWSSSYTPVVHCCFGTVRANTYVFTGFLRRQHLSKGSRSAFLGQVFLGRPGVPRPKNHTCSRRVVVWPCRLRCQGQTNIIVLKMCVCLPWNPRPPKTHMAKPTLRDPFESVVFGGFL